MAWLRVDDGMPEHRKVLALPRKDRWTWMELLCYVARQNNGGHVPEGVCDVLRWVTPAFLQTCVNNGLLDRENDGLKVHDWNDYNPRDPTAAERMRRYRSSHRDATVTEDVTGTVTAGDTPPARAGARGPSPTPVTTTTSSSTTDPPDPHDDEETATRLQAAGWSDGRIAIIAGRGHLDLAARWLTHAEQDPTIENPGAYAYTMTDGGTEPPASRERQPTLAKGATGTRSTSPPTPHRAPEPELERLPPPAEFVALANGHPAAPEPVVSSRARKTQPGGGSS